MSFLTASEIGFLPQGSTPKEIVFNVQSLVHPSKYIAAAETNDVFHAQGKNRSLLSEEMTSMMLENVQVESLQYVFEKSKILQYVIDFLTKTKKRNQVLSLVVYLIHNKIMRSIVDDLTFPDDELKDKVLSFYSNQDSEFDKIVEDNKDKYPILFEMFSFEDYLSMSHADLFSQMAKSPNLERFEDEEDLATQHKAVGELQQLIRKNAEPTLADIQWHFSLGHTTYRKQITNVINYMSSTMTSGDLTKVITTLNKTETGE